MSVPQVRIFFFGDSICFGQGVPPHRVWVTRLAQTMEERLHRRAELVTQNPSVNGNTTRMALERIAYDLQSHEPHVVFIQFGMNDCNGWETDRGHPRVSPDAFGANLSEIIDRARRFGAKQIILGTNHPTTRTVAHLPYVSHTYDEANRAYNEITRRVASTKQTLLADAELTFDEHVLRGHATLGDFVF